MRKNILTHFQRFINYRRFESYRSNMKYLSQQEAISIDEELFSAYKYSVDQLMELAGLSCASAIYHCYDNIQNVLVYCGPGNNGGDGLVCARHLKLFGLSPSVYVQRSKKANSLYQNLEHQCVSMGIEILQNNPDLKELDSNYNLIVDALFGFSFKPPVRSDFQGIMFNLRNTSTKIASIDIPSGWDVETGPPEDGIKPEFLISLTAPKKCAQLFKGKHHYLGGRFVPPELQSKYNLQLPKYNETNCYVKL